jgi:peptide/nickel transport system permease protein
MTKYIIKRVIQAIPLLLIITIITFAIINFAPGDPVRMFINPESEADVDLDSIRAQYGLDKPIHIRYFVWLGNILKGDFGISYYYKKPVMDLIMEYLPNTVLLSFTSLLLAIIIAIPAGVWSAVKKNSNVDYFFSTFSLIGVSIPNFWYGIMLIVFFGLTLGWLPTSGMRSNMDEFDLMDRIKHLILPTIVLATSSMASKLRFMRSSMLESIGQDYVKTARSKGLSEGKVLFKHAFRNALLPIITMLGFWIPSLVSGSAITETIFAWPGIGRLLINANFTRDYPIIMAELVITSTMVIIGSLVADILYAIVDPRIKYD